MELCATAFADTGFSGGGDDASCGSAPGVLTALTNGSLTNCSHSEVSMLQDGGASRLGEGGLMDAGRRGWALGARFCAVCRSNANVRGDAQDATDGAKGAW